MESRHEGQEVPGASGRMGRPDIAYRNEDSTQILRRRYGDPCSVQRSRDMVTMGGPIGRSSFMKQECAFIVVDLF